MTTIEQDGGRKHARAAGMQVDLRRAQVLVPGEFLRDHRVARVLGRPRAKLVTQRVPHEPLVAAVLQACKGEQPAPPTPKDVCR